jgi:hypothetical protein
MFTLATNERVNKVEIWLRPVDYKWYKIKITLNSGVTLDYDGTPVGTTTSLYTYTVPFG